MRKLFYVSVVSVVLITSLEPVFGETLVETVQRLSDAVEKLKTQCGPLNNVYFGPGYASFNGAAGKQVAFIGEVNTGHGVVQLNTPGGQRQLALGSGPLAGAYARLYNKTGAEVVNISALSNGKGTIEVNGSGLADFSEVFELLSRTNVIPGTVMSATESEGRLRASSNPYDPGVVGVISGAGDLQLGMRIGTREDGTKDLPVALIGQVYVRISDEGGPVQVGDLLVSSSRPGVAMRAADRSRACGCVIGKALGPYNGSKEAAEGLVRMLVMNR